MTAAADESLAALARAATPGPWWIHKSQRRSRPHIRGESAYVAEFITDENAPHIAAWSPERALAALGVIEAARGQASPKSAKALDAALATWDKIK